MRRRAVTRLAACWDQSGVALTYEIARIVVGVPEGQAPNILRKAGASARAARGWGDGRWADARNGVALDREARYLGSNISMRLEDYVHPGVLGRLEHLSREYSSAEPFPHIVVDNLLRDDFCDRLIEQFPPFERGSALNENGKLGRKATCEDVRDLGAAYVQMDELVRSQEFLNLVSRVTGIPDLLYDPDYVGGGTHENLPGQDLDPHVDFNYHPKTGWHRRFNAILYLNPSWDVAWGGGLELHRNPWNAKENTIKTVLPLKNRCIIFETSERSWHGFRSIEPTPAHPNLTRRSFAIYLYTRTRPPRETAPSHSTVYVERPLPSGVVAGRPLSSEDAEQIKRLLVRRATHVERLFKREQGYEALIRQVLARLCNSPDILLDESHCQLLHFLIDAQDEQLKALYEREKRFATALELAQRVAASLPEPASMLVRGRVRLSGELRGYWQQDHWAGPTLSIPLRATGTVRRIVVSGTAADQGPQALELTARANGQSWSTKVQRGAFTWDLPLCLDKDTLAELVIETSPAWSPSETGSSPDKRRLAFLLRSIAAPAVEQ